MCGSNLHCLLGHWQFIVTFQCICVFVCFLKAAILGSNNIILLAGMAEVNEPYPNEYTLDALLQLSLFGYICLIFEK